MAAEPVFDWRRSDRRLYLVIAICFALIVFIGFGPTYYLKFAFDNPPVKSYLVHLHGLIMSLWVVFFALQVWFIRTKRHRVHMNLGMIGAALAVLILTVGFFTAAASAKFGSASTPPDIPPMSFFIVPLTDLLMFAGLFTAAILYRRSPATHKRLMLLTVLNFLPPAIGRIPVPQLQAAGPLFFFGVPTLAAIVLITLDTWQNGKLNRPFLIGALILIASYPLRIVISGTETWLSFAVWIITWAA